MFITNLSGLLAIGGIIRPLFVSYQPSTTAAWRISGSIGA